MKHFKITPILVILALHPPLFARPALTVPGTGDSQELLRALVLAYKKSPGGVKIAVPNSIGSGGGVKALAAGKVELARTARPLKEKEKTGLVSFLFAKSPVVFVAHPSVKRVSRLTSKQILAIYSGGLVSWRDLGGAKNKIYPINREPGDSSRNVLAKTLPGFAELEFQAKIVYSTPEAVETLLRHKYTLGYLPLSSTQNTVLKVFALDGVRPSPRNVINGSYKYVTPLYLISRGEPRGQAKHFLNFVYSKPAQRIMRRMGVVPVQAKR